MFLWGIWRTSKELLDGFMEMDLLHIVYHQKSFLQPCRMAFWNMCLTGGWSKTASTKMASLPKKSGVSWVWLRFLALDFQDIGLTGYQPVDFQHMIGFNHLNTLKPGCSLTHPVFYHPVEAAMRARLLGEGEGRSYECLELKMAGKSVSWLSEMILPWNLTWNLKMEVWKIIFLFSWVIRLPFLGGGNSTIFGMFTPKTWGRWLSIYDLRILFRWVGSTTN